MRLGLMLSCSRPVSWQVLHGSGDPGGLVRERQRDRESSRDLEQFPTGKSPCKLRSSRSFLERSPVQVTKFAFFSRTFVLVAFFPPPKTDNFYAGARHDNEAIFSFLFFLFEHGRKWLSVQNGTRASGVGRDKILIIF